MNPEGSQFEKENDNPRFGSDESAAKYQDALKKQRADIAKQDRINKTAQDVLKKLNNHSKKTAPD